MTQEKYSKGIEEFIRFLNSCKEAYNISLSTQEETEAMTQDLLHCLELEDNTYHQQAKLGRTISQIRKERRSAKYTIQQLQPVIDWIDANQTTIRGLEKLLGQVRKEELKTNPELLCYHDRTDIVKQTLGKEEK